MITKSIIISWPTVGFKIIFFIAGDNSDSEDALRELLKKVEMENDKLRQETAQQSKSFKDYQMVHRRIHNSCL